MFRRIRLIFIASLTTSAFALAQTQSQSPDGTAQPQTIRLWEGAAPGAQGDADADVPTITIYRPSRESTSRAAIVVCPGGGYGGLAAHEGKPVAEWLKSLGITGVVLKYRLARAITIRSSWGM